MADDQIAVELVAKVGELTAGLGQARDEMGRFCKSIEGDLHGLSETAKESEHSLEGILHIEQFRMFREAAEMALEGVKSAFESTVGAAEQFGLSTSKFADMMGMSEEHAAGLSAALTNVGSSTEVYETLALRLEKSLRSTGGASEELKSKFKDTHGEFLTGAPLMERLKEVTDSYSEGAARTSVELALLGRGTKAYYDISRVTAEATEHNSEIYKQMGVDFSTLREKSRQLEDAEGDLRTAWQAEQVVIGQELMPVAMAAMQWLGGPGKELLQDMGTAVKFLMTTFDVLKAAVVSAVVAIVGSLTEVWDALKLGGKLIEDLTTGNISRMASDFKASTKEMAQDASAMGKTIGDEWAGVTEHAKAMWAPDAAPAAAPKKSGLAAPEHLTHQGKGKSDKSGEKTEDEEIKNDEKIALARIAIAESTNQHLLSMDEEASSQFIAERTRLENETYAVKLTALTKEYDLHEKSKAAREKYSGELALLEVTHQGALTKINQDGESQRAAASKESITEFLKTDDDRLKSGMAAIARLEQSHKLSIDVAAGEEARLTQAVRQEQIARVTAEMDGLDKGSKAYAKAAIERAKLEEQLSTEMDAIQAKHFKSTSAQVQTWATPMTAGFKTAIADMVLHAKTFSQAMNDMGNTILDGFVNVCLQMGEQWLLLQITNAIVGENMAGTAGRAQIATSAAVAAAAAFASTAAIPIVGIAAAPAAATAAYGATMAWQAAVPAAEGGMLLDRDRLVYAHKDEQILPAHLSKGIQAMIAGGNAGGGGGGDTNLHYSPTINAPQAKGLEQMLRDESGAMLAFFANASRDGKLRSRIG